MRPRTPGLLPLPQSREALRAELERLERAAELAARSPAPARRLLAIERRRVIIRLDELGGWAA